MNDAWLGISVFIACVVEMVEALTIVLAIGTTRNWRATLLGAGAAVISLGIVIAVFGSVLAQLTGESSSIIKRLWLILGSLLLVFGLQWMRKAILRFSGLLASHDEDEAYKKLRHQAAKVDRDSLQFDWYAFIIVFKGVWLEGLEVVFIVLTFGASQGSIGVGVVAAGAAFVLITLLGIVIHRPLSRIPENAMKFGVGVLLTGFGTFFASKGVGIVWPSEQLAIIELVSFYLAIGLSLTWLIRHSQRAVRMAS